MKAKDCMTEKVELIKPETTIKEAAEKMKELDIGALLVEKDDRLVGVITDRDIVIRALAEGFDPSASVSEAMSEKVLYCFEDDACEEVCANLGKNKIHRLPVLNRDKRLVGIITIGDLSTKGHHAAVGEALRSIKAR